MKDIQCWGIGILSVIITSYTVFAGYYINRKIDDIEDDLYQACLQALLLASCFDILSVIGTSIVRSKDICSLLIELDEIDKVLCDATTIKAGLLDNLKRTLVHASGIGMLFIIGTFALDFGIKVSIGCSFTTLLVWYTFKVTWYLISQFRLLLFCALCYLVNVRLSMVNHLLIVAKLEIKLKQFVHLRRVQSAILKIMHNLDNIFNPDIVVSLGASTIYVVVLLFLTASPEINETNKFLGINIYLCQALHATMGIATFLRVAAVAYMGEAVAFTAKEPSRIYCDMDMNEVETNLQLQISLFENQIESRQLHPTAAGFFDLGKSMLCTVVGILLTYVIVLLQFQVSSYEGLTFEEVTNASRTAQDTLSRLVSSDN
ncbi:uncharacterized protein LOC136024677 [Artemia franciscana]|uniref:uncharacterized protein LOC136024677 n=1 Tax=Artemia franciscana TaxID=6661 RepID=UPI0032DB52E2